MKNEHNRGPIIFSHQCYTCADRARRARAEARQQQGDVYVAGRSIEKLYSATCRRLLTLCDGKRVLREGGGDRGGEDAVALGGERRPRGRG